MSRSARNKPPSSPQLAPTFVDHDAGRAASSWEAARRELAGLPGGRGLNIAHEAVDRHANGPDGDRLALDLQPDDVFWCTADPGWVTGTSYGIIAPLTNGVTSIVDGADFDAARWYRILQEQRVTVWYTAPTAIRMLMKAGTELARDHDLRSLRFLGSVGEPLNPEAVVWGEEAFGSMGKPLPGIEAAIVRVDEDGLVTELTEANA